MASGPAASSALADSLRRVAATRPTVLAVCEPGRSLTYSEFTSEMDRASQRLATAAAGNGAVLLLTNPNGIDWLATFLGALDAGATVAVLDPTVPAAQREVIEACLEPAAVLRDGRLSLRGGGAERAVARALAAHCRVVYFTSGSTGLPRGVMLPEGNLLQNAYSAIDRLGLTASDVCGQCLPLSHGYNVIFALATLLAGAALHLERGLSDLSGVLTRLDAAGLTVLQVVPTALRLLVERGDLARWPLRSLRMVRVGAGVLTDQLAALTFGAFPQPLTLVTTYGTTELGLVASRAWKCSPIQESTFDVLAPGVSLRIVDPEDEGLGEIELSHEQLFAGYFEPAESPGAHPVGAPLHGGSRSRGA
jgi:acyl-CoA synthetase (AMP-forming)/AMP-acid ligase II